MSFAKYQFPSPLIPATIILRINRFLALVEIRGFETYAFVANSGRLPELMTPGTPAWLEPIPQYAESQSSRKLRPKRRTAYDLVLVRFGDILVCVDTRIPNILAGTALRAGSLPGLDRHPQVYPESIWGQSRFDFRLAGIEPQVLVEVKSVTLANNGYGLFPDAPTTRGQKHVSELAAAVQAGWRGALLFVVQRSDVNSVAPNDDTDPVFGDTLRAAAHQGVEVRAFGCSISEAGIDMHRELPVYL